MRSARRSPLSASLVLLAALASRTSAAHTNGVAVAYPTSPVGVVVVDDSFTLSWRDSDMRSGTSTPTIDWFYTATIPPTFPVGVIPEEIDDRTPIAAGIPEPDLANAVVWDTSAVPSGAYWVWSRVNEPPSEIAIVHVAAFSAGVVIVAHPGDEVPPAVVITEPNAPAAYADRSFLIRYSAFDPDGSGRVKLEAYRDGSSEMITLADDLDPTSDGSLEWDTSQLAPGDWAIRATIEDGRGDTFTAYSRFFLSIMHVDPPDPPGEGCSCTSASEGTLPRWSLLFGLSLLLRRRSRPGAPSRTPPSRRVRSVPSSR